MQKDEIIKCIQKAKVTSQTNLYLSGNELSDVPVEIGQLSNLTIIN